MKLGGLTAVVAVVAIAAAAVPANAEALPPAPPSASLAGGLLGSLNPITAGAGALAGLGLTALGSWVLDGARAALQETAGLIDRTTSPRLRSTWFSGTYWRVAGLAALLTLPFLFAAAAQALLRSDLTLLMRAALGYLPLALLGVSIAAPVTMLALAATDQMCAVVAAVGSGGGTNFLRQTATVMAGLGALDGSPFLAFAIGLFTLAVAIALAVEMLVREAAVYVVLLMLPLAFASLVWPARRIWAIRMVELLVALILSKFVIVAVLALAGAAFGGRGLPSATRLLTAMALLMLSTFAPWVLMRLLPFTELAAGAAGALSAELPRLKAIPASAMSAAEGPAAWAESLPGRLRRETDPGAPGEVAGADPRAWGAPPERQSEPGAGAPVASTATGAPGPTEGPEHGGGPAPAGGPTPTGGPSQSGDGAQAGQAVAERLPGMDPIWQAEDGAWPPMVLGPGGWSGPTDYQPPQANPPHAEPPQDGPPQDNAPGGSAEPHLPPRQEDQDIL